MPKKGYKQTKEHREKIGIENSISKVGTHYSDEHKRKIGIANTGEKSASWKGENVGYRALHRWVEKYLGKPHFCENCGQRGLKHRSYHWANISGKYKRILSDWIRLCAKCHAKFDGVTLK